MMNGKDEKTVLAEIERDEAWLAEVLAACPAPECGSLAGLKHQVRIAVHEMAIALDDPPPMSARTVAGIKAAVRAEIAAGAARTTAERAGRSRRGWYRYGWAPLAAAAVLALVMVPLGRERPGAGQSTASVDRLDDFVAVVTSYAERVDEDITLLREDVDAFDRLLVTPGDTWFEQEVDELSDDIDRLSAERESIFDV